MILHFVFSSSDGRESRWDGTTSLTGSDNDREKSKKGQALTEFVFVFPLLFLLFLIILQLGVVSEKRLCAQKSIWLALRGYSLVEHHWYQPTGRYSRKELKNMVKQNFFSKDDEVNVDFTDYVGGVKANVTCKTPFLYKGLNWQPMWDVFKGIVKNNKIELKVDGSILKSPMATKL